MIAQNTGETPLPPINAAAKVLVSSDGLEARLRIDPPQNGGEKATFATLSVALRLAKVVHGIDEPLLHSLAEQPEYGTEIVIAKGKPPVNGADGTMRLHFNPVAGAARPKVKENGAVDYRDLGLIENVRKGQALCTITPPTPGTPGIAVTGREIPPVPGKTVTPPLGRGTSLSGDKTQVLADVDGQVTMTGGRIQVQNTITVTRDVDNSTGNIKFVGNVVIFGSVREGFTVEAEGNVEIGGVVEGGSVTAGGNLTISRGIVGMNRSRILAKGDLQTTFIENATVETQGSLQAESLMNCMVNCEKNIKLVGMHARIVGGRYTVGGDIIAEKIGSSSHIPTELILGASPSISARQNELNKTVPKLRNEITKLNQIILLLSQQKKQGLLSPAREKMLENSQESLKSVTMQLIRTQAELRALNEKVEKTKHGKIVCAGIMHGGVHLLIGFARMQLDEHISASVFSCEKDSINIAPL